MAGAADPISPSISTWRACRSACSAPRSASGRSAHLRASFRPGAPRCVNWSTSGPYRRIRHPLRRRIITSVASRVARGDAGGTYLLVIAVALQAVRARSRSASSSPMPAYAEFRRNTVFPLAQAFLIVSETGRWPVLAGKSDRNGETVMRLMKALIETPMARQGMLIGEALRICVDKGRPRHPVCRDSGRIIGGDSRCAMCFSTTASRAT